MYKELGNTFCWRKIKRNISCRKSRKINGLGLHINGSCKRECDGYHTNQEPSPNQLRHLGELALGRLQAKNYYSRTDEG